MTSQTDDTLQSDTVQRILAVLRRQTKLIVISFLALSAGVVAAILARPPLYEGTLKVLVKQDRADSVVSGLPEHSASRYFYRELTETEVMSQVELLKSKGLIEQVAVDTGLAARLREEEPSLTAAQSVEYAAESLTDRLDIAPVKRTWLINITYEGDDRGFTRNVLDTLARLYLQKHLSLQRPSGTYQFFTDQTRLAKRELESFREQLATFSLQHQVVSATIEKQAVLQNLSEFDAMRLQAAAQLAESQRRLATVNAELARVPSRHTAAVKTDVGVARDITARIMSLEMQRTQLLQKFTPTYQGVVQVDGQLRDARAALDAARQAPVVEETIADNPTRQWLDTEVSRTRADQAALQARVSALADAVTHYRATAMNLELRDAEQKGLERELKAAETKYLLYAQKQEEARISDELDRTRIANVVVAEGPSVAVDAQRDPSLALLPLLLGAALLLSGGLAVAVDACAPACRSWKSERRPTTAVLVHPAPSEQPVS